MLKYAVICLVASLAFSNAAVSSTGVGEKLALCTRNNPEYESCLKDRLQVVIPDITKNGLAELGLESSDPAVIPEMLVQYRNGNWTADMIVKNSRTWGISGVQIQAVRTNINDPKDFHAEVDFIMPSIYSEGDYKLDAKLLIPINSKGYFNISMSNVSATWEVSGEHFSKGGEDYVRITSFSMLPEVGDMKVYASNLFPDNEELSQAALDFSNRYWRFIYKELLPVTNEAWGMVMRNALNRVFLRVPFNKLFPEA